MSFAALRRWLSETRVEKLREIRYWGANSLVFYIVNNAVIRFLEMLIPHGFGLFVLSILITALLLRAALRMQALTRRQPPSLVLLSGALVVLVILATEKTIGSSAPHHTPFICFGLTLSFLACHPAWRNVTAPW